MAENQLGDGGAEFGDPISQIEYFIQEGNTGTASAGRKALRNFLFSRVTEENAEGSVGDALAMLARSPHKDVLSAIIILRCLAVDELVPAANSNNSISRSIVELCEGALPELFAFLRIDKKAQNFEKFAILCRCHSRILQLLSPLAAEYGDLDALLCARRDILGCLNHSIIKLYADPFFVKDVRTTIEVVFGRIKKVAGLETTVLSDIEECKRVIASAKSESVEFKSFLVQGFLIPYLSTCEKVLGSYLESLRSRFTTSVVRRADGRVELQKRYPLHEIEREIQVAIPLKVTGPGMATDLRVLAEMQNENVVLQCKSIGLGNVFPGDFSVVLDLMIVSPCENISGVLEIRWGEIGNPAEKSTLLEFEILAQTSAVDWRLLTYTAPYSTDVAKGAEFIGREELVRQLAAKLLRHPMESFYITGQKRVGKTSLALAVADFAQSHDPDKMLEYQDILWGSVAHADATTSVQRLGEEIEAHIIAWLPPEFKISRGDYRGSLAPLIGLSRLALKVCPNKKFVIILDEFDDIPQDLFLQGNLAETFFANMRALSRCRNICIVLVGGENMPFIMERQGEKLNNFSRVNLSYYSRTTEWNDFVELVRKPTESILNWHEDAISEVFNVTHGNPYFAKIVCSGVFRSAVAERDADITVNEVQRATESQVSGLGANSFVHLWRDGIPRAISEREPDILRRLRTLVAIARCKRSGHPMTAPNIVQSKASQSLRETEVPIVLNDFVKRDVLCEHDGRYEFCLPIFSLWLVDVGAGQLIVDGMSEEIADIVLSEENKAVVRSVEVASLVRGWPTYRGQHIGTDDVRAWYQQVENPKEQRILFELLKRTRVFSEVLVRERLRSARAFVQASLPDFVIRRKGDRRRDIVVTYVDGPGKSGGTYASLYAEENGIAANCVLTRSGFKAEFEKVCQNGPVNAVVIIDDIAATGRSLGDNVETFISEFRDFLARTKIRVVTLVATEGAQKRILRKLDAWNDVDVEFRTCEVLEDEHFALPSKAGLWESDEQAARAKALCADLGSRIYRDNPLGYGGLGLLVVFPTTVPNNSLPILHSYSRAGSTKTWTPLFERIAK